MKKLTCCSIQFVIAVTICSAQLPLPLEHGVRTTGDINAMAYDSVNNKLYVGGYFENIGGIEVNNIAMWDGVQWHGLGSGISGSVSKIKCYNGNVYVGGYFEMQAESA